MNSNIDIKALAQRILEEENIHPGDKMSYIRLSEISEKYNISPKSLAIYVFGATEPQYRSIRSESANAKCFVVLKKLQSKYIEEAISQRDRIMQEEGIGPGYAIDYAKLVQISKKYSISEEILAVNVLRIRQRSYTMIKNNPVQKAICFYEKKKEQKQIIPEDDSYKELRLEILQNENLCMGDKIDYETLVAISKKYNIDEKKLAVYILGMPKTAYFHIKYNHESTTTVLRERICGQWLEKLSQQIMDSEGIHPYAQINYDILRKLSLKYHVNEKVLAVKILGVTENCYWNVKYGKAKVFYVLKGQRKESSLEDLRNLRQRIYTEEGLYPGKSIKYEEISKMQEKYETQLGELLYILGITSNAYAFIKSHKEYQTIVKDMEKYLVSQIIAEIIEKERYYTKSEINSICQKNNISIQEFFDYIFGKGRYYGYTEYERVLDEKGKIWIGDRRRLSEEFVEENINDIMKTAKTVGKYLYGIYKSKKRAVELADIEQEAILFMIESCGDLEKNFEGEELFRIMYFRTRRNWLKNALGDSKAVSITGFYTRNQGRDRFDNKTDLELVDAGADTERKVLERCEDTREKLNIIGYLSKLVEEGYSREEALKETAEVFGIEQSEMLEVLKNEILRRGNVKKNKRGEYYI